MNSWARTRSDCGDGLGSDNPVSPVSFAQLRREIFQYWDAQQLCHHEHHELVEGLLLKGIDYQKRILQYVEKLGDCASLAADVRPQLHPQADPDVSRRGDSCCDEADIAGSSHPAAPWRAAPPQPSGFPRAMLLTNDTPPFGAPQHLAENGILPGQPQADEDGMETRRSDCSWSCEEQEHDPRRLKTYHSTISQSKAVEGHRREWAAHLRSSATQFLDENKNLRSPAQQNATVQPSLLARMVQHIAFEWLSTVIIVTNASFEGYMAHVGMKQTLASPEQADPEWFLTVAAILASFLGIEVICKLCAYRKLFFTGAVKFWNVFDLILVLSSGLEFLQPQVGIGSVSFIRGLRLFRVLRVIRVFRIFRDLRLMVCMVAQSLWSLCWALVLLILIMYIFAIIFMQSIIMHLRSQNPKAMDPTFRKDIMPLYGSIWDTLYTLFAGISGGIDWIQATTCLQEVSPVLKAAFAVYIFFMVIGVLNVLTGVFVERASELSGLDKDLVIQSQLKRNKQFLTEMTKIFHEADVDNSGTLDWDEFRDYLQDATVQAYLSTQQLDAFDARTLFDQLKLGAHDEINMDDFIIGCQQLKGQARSVELIAVLKETRSINKKLRDYVHSQVTHTSTV